VAVLQGQVQQLGAGLASGAEDEATHVRVSWVGVSGVIMRSLEDPRANRTPLPG
jgi:hypothetical protein